MDQITVGAFGASFDNVMLPMGLMLNHVLIQGKAGTIFTDPLNIQLDSPGQVEVHVHESSLSAFLEKESPAGMRDVNISAQSGVIKLKATVKVLFEIKAEALCTLKIVNGKQLFVVLESVEMAGVGAKSLAEQQLEKINPVLDVADLPLNLTLESVRIENGEIVLHGTANLKT
ncbi:MAG: DUF2993 domain-containing protein [Fimbriimonadaceae bacterium]